MNSGGTAVAFLVPLICACGLPGEVGARPPEAGPPPQLSESLPTPAASPVRVLRAGTNCVVEWTYETASEYSSPFHDVRLIARVSAPGGATLDLPAYWDGGKCWSFRFSAPRPARYTFQTICSPPTDRDLHDQKGVIELTPYDGDIALLKRGALHVSADARHLEHADGTPFLWLADSWWHGMTTRLPWPEGFQRLARDRAAKGFSVIQFAIAFPCDIEPFDSRGANEYGHAWDRQFDAIEPGYFQRVDERVAFLVEQGLVPNIVGAWGYYLAWMGIDNAKRHWEYLIARYGAYPVTWTVCGEAKMPYYVKLDGRANDPQAQREGWSEVARFIQSRDPFERLVTVHPGTTLGNQVSPLADMSSLDFIMLMAGHTEDGARAESLPLLRRALAEYPDKPVLFGEIAFEGMHGGECGPKVQRYLFWTALLNGACGHSYGADAIWQFNTREASFGPSPSGITWGNWPWEDAMNWGGAEVLGVGRKLLLALPWWRLEPHPEWVKAAGTESLVTTSVAGIPGQLRVYYFPRSLPNWGSRPTVLGLEPGVTYRGTFVSPIDGRSYDIGPVAGDGQGHWAVPPGPILQDWVLLLDAREE